ncbi:MAG: Autotransporter-associated beta strand repeat protein, partial [Verrucomicrobiales bacterium]|nr:Autotransporter-associated beta strand repeat protein [Verrucomicrobiales bacterium]
IGVKVLPGSGTLTNVDFFLGGTRIGSSTNSSFSFEVSDLPVGANVLSATVTDSFGLTASAGEITVNIALSVNQMAGRKVGTNQFIVCFLGLTGTNYILEATSDVAGPIVWTPIQTNQAGANILQFFDTDVPKHSVRFYRARKQ